MSSDWEMHTKNADEAILIIHQERSNKIDNKILSKTRMRHYHVNHIALIEYESIKLMKVLRINFFNEDIEKILKQTYGKTSLAKWRYNIKSFIHLHNVLIEVTISIKDTEIINSSNLSCYIVLYKIQIKIVNSNANGCIYLHIPKTNLNLKKVRLLVTYNYYSDCL